MGLAVTARKRILLLEHGMDGTVGGSHYCLLEICRGLDRTRFEPVARFFQPNSLLEEFRRIGCQVTVRAPRQPLSFAARASGPMRSLLQPLQSLANVGVLLGARTYDWIRELRQERIDLVHLNNSFNGDHDLMLATRLLGIPCIAHQRGDPGMTGRFEMLFTRLLDSMVAISTAVRDDMVARGAPVDRIRLIHDGIDPARINPTTAPASIRAALGIPEGAVLIGIVGNVKYWKGQHVVIEAMRHIDSARHDVHCALVGALADAPYVQRLREMTTQYGLDSKVHFVGFQRNPADYMAAMDIVLHTSVEAEPFGLVVLEAMALRKPLVSTTIGGPRDIVLEGVTGFLTPAGDSDALAHRVLQLLADPQLMRSMGVAGYQRLAQSFTAKRNVEEITRLYDELLDESPNLGAGARRNA